MFYREDERRDLMFHVRQGHSVLMLAPRRVGKTWLLKRFAEDLRAAGWMAVLCDVQGMNEPKLFLRHLCQEIEEQEKRPAKLAEGRARQILNQLVSSDFSKGWQAALVSMDWSSFAETLVRGLNAGPQDTVILVDELALFVLELVKTDAVAAKNFLYTLRGLQLRYPRVRWLFTGSIGLDTIAKREGIGGALLDMHLFPIEPFSHEAARAFLDHLSLSRQVLRPFALDEAVLRHFIDELGWLSPYYLEHIAQQMRADGPPGPDGRCHATVANVDAAFAVMLDAQHRNYFIAWEEHLAKNFPKREADALAFVLDICAAGRLGERFDTLSVRLGGPPFNIARRPLRDLLTILVADGYLSEIPEADCLRYRFRSGLLRRYWQRYHAE